MKKRILVINTVPTDKNGITNVIFSYYCPILTDSYILDYVSINEVDDYYQNKIKNSGGVCYVLPRQAGSIAHYFCELFRIISSRRYDAVHIHGNSHTVLIELYAAFLAKCKVRIVHAHATSSKYPLFHHILSPLFHCVCNKRLACSEYAGKWMYGKRHFIVIRNGVDTKRFAFNHENRNKIREKIGWQNKVVLSHVGDFSANKNQIFLIDVLKRLNKDGNIYGLVLIGEGELKQVVNEKVNQEGLEQCVLFTGKISDVERYLSGTDCILLPSFHEGLPLSLVEQQANGLRCIISDSITREANITGNITYLPLDFNEWANVIGRISIDNKNDREIRSKQSIKQLQTAGYDVRASAIFLKQFYSSNIL